MVKHGSYRRIEALTLLVAGLLLAALVAGCGTRGGGAGDGGGENGEKKTYRIQLSHVVAPETPKGLAAEKFKELVEKKTDGRVTVEVYPNSELYGDEDELQAIQSGAVQMLAPTTSKFTTITPKFQVLDLPFIYDSYEDIPEVTAKDTEVGKLLYENEDLAKRNTKVLALWVDGLKQFTANDPIRQPEDFKGLKIRVQPADVLRRMFETWGAKTANISFGELYSALQQGVVDGHENPYSVIYGSKANEVQDYLTESNHGANVSVAVINQDFYDSLPEDLQQAVTEAAEEAAEYNLEVAEKENEEGKQQIIDDGETEVIELSEAERNAFKEVVVPDLWNQFADEIGPEAVTEIKEREGSE